jgi:hypothetical protein
MECQKMALKRTKKTPDPNVIQMAAKTQEARCKIEVGAHMALLCAVRAFRRKSACVNTF